MLILEWLYLLTLGKLSFLIYHELCLWL